MQETGRKSKTDICGIQIDHNPMMLMVVQNKGVKKKTGTLKKDNQK